MRLCRSAEARTLVGAPKRRLTASQSSHRIAVIFAVQQEQEMAEMGHVHAELLSQTQALYLERQSLEQQLEELQQQLHQQQSASQQEISELEQQLQCALDVSVGPHIVALYILLVLDCLASHSNQ